MKNYIPVNLSFAVIFFFFFQFFFYPMQLIKLKQLKSEQKLMSNLYISHTNVTLLDEFHQDGAVRYCYARFLHSPLPSFNINFSFVISTAMLYDRPLSLSFFFVLIILYQDHEILHTHSHRRIHCV